VFKIKEKKYKKDLQTTVWDLGLQPTVKQVDSPVLRITPPAMAKFGTVGEAEKEKWQNEYKTLVSEAPMTVFHNWEKGEAGGDWPMASMEFPEFQTSQPEYRGMPEDPVDAAYREYENLHDQIVVPVAEVIRSTLGV
jgi:hypothetical protein